MARPQLTNREREKVLCLLGENGGKIGDLPSLFARPCLNVMPSGTHVEP